MTELPRQEAATALGISPAKLLRVARTGVGRVSQGGGRGRRSMYDVEAIRQALAQPIPQRQGSGHALTFVEALLDHINVLHQTGAWQQFGVPPHQSAAVTCFLVTGIVRLARDELKDTQRLSIQTLLAEIPAETESADEMV